MSTSDRNLGNRRDYIKVQIKRQECQTRTNSGAAVILLKKFTNDVTSFFLHLRDRKLEFLLIFLTKLTAQTTPHVTAFWLQIQELLLPNHV